MKEAYVKFGTAMRLKECRFNWQCTHYYDDDGTMHKAMDYVIQNDEDEDDNNECLCPTQQMACEWLKEEKGMYISVVPDFNEYGEYPDDLYWFARVYDLRNGDYIHSTKLCKSSQEAFETALQYVLTNLI